VARARGGGEVIIAASVAAVAGAVTITIVSSHRGGPAARDPWADPVPSSEPAGPTVTVTGTGMDNADRETLRSFVGVFDKATRSPNVKMEAGDRALVKGFVSVFDRILDSGQPAPVRARDGEPTTAAGWLELAKTQPPGDAVASIRRALALNPGWSDAQSALCVALTATWDDGALDVCDAALAQRDDLALHAARGAARLHAGQAAAALADLDKVVAADPDPKWRRLRAHARKAVGDEAGAKRDLADACSLGDSLACHPK
jgi:hypothetical protein